MSAVVWHARLGGTTSSPKEPGSFHLPPVRIISLPPPHCLYLYHIIAPPPRLTFIRRLVNSLSLMILLRKTDSQSPFLFSSRAKDVASLLLLRPFNHRYHALPHPLMRPLMILDGSKLWLKGSMASLPIMPGLMFLSTFHENLLALNGFITILKVIFVAWSLFLIFY